MASFFNTINFQGKELERANARAASLETVVLSLFKANPGLKLGPSKVLYILNRKYSLNNPITSVRRAMTNLTGRLELIKTEERVNGLFNYPEHCWQLSNGSEKTPNNKAKLFIQTDLFKK